jgi:hypothetical protein
MLVRHAPRASLVLFVPALLHCGSSSSQDVAPADAGASNDGGATTFQDAPSSGASGCAAGAELVHLVTIENTHNGSSGVTAVLRSFDPRTLAFRTVGDLSPCLPQGIDISGAYGISIDRTGVATVLVYASGEPRGKYMVVRARISDASCVHSDPWPESNGTPGGLAPVGAGAGGPGDAMFVAVGAVGLQQGSLAQNYRLARVDVATFATTPVGALEDQPNLHPLLTGTGDGRLYSLTHFADGSGPYYLRQRDTTSASAVMSFAPIALPATTEQVWSFFFWGGRFYLFYVDKNTDTPSAETAGTIAMFDSSTQALTTVAEHVPWAQAAGVSTCAPLTPPK